jgi:hypothetical protein
MTPIQSSGAPTISPFSRPFLWLFLEATKPVVASNDPTVAETETESGKDGIVKKDYADDEDEDDGSHTNTLLLADSGTTEDDD